MPHRGLPRSPASTYHTWPKPNRTVSCHSMLGLVVLVLVLVVLLLLEGLVVGDGDTADGGAMRANRGAAGVGKVRWEVTRPTGVVLRWRASVGMAVGMGMGGAHPRVPAVGHDAVM